MEFRLCARGRQWCSINHNHWWTASIKPRLLFSRAGYASLGISISSVKFIFKAVFPILIRLYLSGHSIHQRVRLYSASDVIICGFRCDIMSCLSTFIVLSYISNNSCFARIEGVIVCVHIARQVYTIVLSVV